jgi:hypothetical protein
VIYGFDWSDAGKAVGVAIGLAILAIIVATSQFRRRLASTS